MKSRGKAAFDEAKQREESRLTIWGMGYLRKPPPSLLPQNFVPVERIHQSITRRLLLL
jgi:hypothetical protein